MTRKRSNKFKGVTYLKDKKLWFARITFSGVRYSLGKFKSYEKATEIYKQALAAGCVAVKAWVNTPVEYRGNFGEKLVGDSDFPKEEEKLKMFKTIQDENQDDILEW